MNNSQKAVLVFLLAIPTIWTCWGSSTPGSIAPPRSKFELYIERYSYAAMQEMQRVGIPASVTLAQGILESDYGQSDLAVNAHNHFGIKCGRDWLGDKFCAYSNEWDPKTQRMVPCLSCFRKYTHPYQCFRDHSEFLLAKERYAGLFRLSRQDYRGWAQGLQQAGYATDPQYANKLISVIERYNLFMFDKGVQY